MECVKCGSAYLINVGTDVFTCDDCGSKMEVTYLVCKNCLSSMRLQNGKIYDTVSLGYEGTSLLDANVSMFDLIDKCLRCSHPVMVENGVYTCLNCGFSWEVMK